MNELRAELNKVTFGNQLSDRALELGSTLNLSADPKLELAFTDYYNASMSSFNRQIRNARKEYNNIRGELRNPKIEKNLEAGRLDEVRRNLNQLKTNIMYMENEKKKPIHVNLRPLIHQFRKGFEGNSWRTKLRNNEKNLANRIISGAGQYLNAVEAGAFNDQTNPYHNPRKSHKRRREELLGFIGELKSEYKYPPRA